MFLQVESEQISIRPETIFSIGSFEFTNAMLMGVMVTLFFLCISLSIYKRKNNVPTSFQAVVEKIVEVFVGLLTSITGSEHLAKKLLPLIGSLFLFLGFSNIVTLIPGLSAITYNGISLFRTPTNDFNMTFSIALAMVILANVMSIKDFGLFGHIGKFVKIKEIYQGFREGVGAGMLAIIDFFIGLLDIVSEFAKVISLSLRLFGNMYAGEVLAAIFLGALAILVPAPWTAMNLLVGILQAMVFGSLTAAYITLAVAVQEQKKA